MVSDTHSFVLRLHSSDGDGGGGGGALTAVGAGHSNNSADLGFESLR